MRVLDVDLDFFVGNPVTWPGSGRPNVSEHPVWSSSAVRRFLRDRCGLEGRLPGFVTERHHEAFGRWREAIDEGRLVAPFDVTHVDAHADLGTGDVGHIHLMELLRLPPSERTRPRIAGSEDPGYMQEGNYLLFAIACRWLSSLEYVHPHDAHRRPLDLHYWYMADFDQHGDSISLPHVDIAQIRDPDRWSERGFDVAEWEPPVGFTVTHEAAFKATKPYDVVCLTRSPQYSPPEADELFEMIRSEFIDEEAWAPGG